MQLDFDMQPGADVQAAQSPHTIADPSRAVPVQLVQPRSWHILSCTVNVRFQLSAATSMQVGKLGALVSIANRLYRSEMEFIQPEKRQELSP